MCQECRSHGVKACTANKYLSSLVGLDAIDGASLIECFERMEGGGVMENYPLNVERDGIFEDDAMFLVFDLKDIKGIMSRLKWAVDTGY
jgi:hypothetical protein